MKKWLACFLALALLAAAAGCGAAPEAAGDAAADAASGRRTDSPAENEAAEAFPEEETEEEAEIEPREETAPAEPREFQKTASIEETVLYEENGVRITAVGLEYGNYNAELKLLIENDTEEELSFVAGSVGYNVNSVNGYMTSDGYLNCDVAPGKKANDSVSFGYDALAFCGIYELADLEIGFCISNEDYDRTYTGPCRIVTSAAESYDYGTDSYLCAVTDDAALRALGCSARTFSEETLYENGGVSVVSAGLLRNEDGEDALVLEVRNESDETAYVATEGIALNGLTVCGSGWSQDTLNPGKTCVVTVRLSNLIEPEFAEAYGIREVGSVSLDFGVCDEYGNALGEAETITVTVPGAESGFSAEGTEVYNANGVRLIVKGIYEDPWEYSGDLHLLMLAENTSGEELYLDDEYDSFSVNDYMTDSFFYGAELRDGCVTSVDLGIYERGLEDNAIDSVEQIETVEFTLVVRNSFYDEIDSSKIQISFS